MHDVSARVMRNHIVAWVGIDPYQTHHTHLQARFLPHFPKRSLFHRFARVNGPSRHAPEAVVSSLLQQDLATLVEDRRSRARADHFREFGERLASGVEEGDKCTVLSHRITPTPWEKERTWLCHLVSKVLTPSQSSGNAAGSRSAIRSSISRAAVSLGRIASAAANCTRATSNWRSR